MEEEKKGTRRSEELLAVLNENALAVIKKEQNKAECELLDQQKLILKAKERLININSKFQLGVQQSELFEFESGAAMQSMRATYQALTPELWKEALSLPPSSKSAILLCAKFLYMLFSTEYSWTEIVKNFKTEFRKIQEAMTNFAPEELSEPQLSQLLPVWKGYTKYLTKIKKYPKGIALILEWIRAGVEYKLKKEIINGSKDKVSEMEEEKNSALLFLEQAKTSVSELENRIAQYEQDIRKSNEISAEERKFFNLELVKKYKMEEYYTLLPNSGDQSGNKITLRNMKGKFQKYEIQDANRKVLAKECTESGRHINEDRYKELQELTSPQDCQAYICKYLNSDLKEIGLNPLEFESEAMSRSAALTENNVRYHPFSSYPESKIESSNHEEGRKRAETLVKDSKKYHVTTSRIKGCSPKLEAASERSQKSDSGPENSIKSGGGIKIDPFGPSPQITSFKRPFKYPGKESAHIFSGDLSEEAEVVPFSCAAKPNPSKYNYIHILKRE